MCLDGPKCKEQYRDFSEMRVERESCRTVMCSKGFSALESSKSTSMEFKQLKEAETCISSRAIVGMALASSYV
jgi:hypothetical protein